MCVGEYLHVCVVSPQRLDSVGCTFSAERALLPRLTPLPRAEAPKASLAAPTSPEETKTIHEINSANLYNLIKYIETYYWILRAKKSHILLTAALSNYKLAEMITILHTVSLFSNKFMFIFQKFIFFSVLGKA